MAGYLVAQDDDQVRVRYPSEPVGVIGTVRQSRPRIYRDGFTTVTARECLVELPDGLPQWIHADDLEVLQG